jgi:SP family sugar porter-like MFS transporter
MLLGAGGLAGIYAVLGSMYFFHLQGLPLLIMVVTAIACYSMTLAPVTWVVLSEIFPTGYVALQCRWLLSHYGQPVSC